MKYKEKYLRSTGPEVKIRLSEKYVGVCLYKDSKHEFWVGNYNNYRAKIRYRRRFDTEKDAALAVDKWRILNDVDPVNILRRV